MPSSITHQLVAEEAAPFFPSAAKEAVSFAPDEFFLGAQGPDVFFFYRIGNKSEYNLGKYLHRNRVYEVFSLFLGALRGGIRFDADAEKRAYAYVLGYIAHYAADSAFHPFVYRLLEERRCDSREHQQIENDWDVFFLRELRGKSAEKYVFPFSPKAIVRGGAVLRLYAYLAEKLGREEVTESRFRRGVKNFSLYLKAFHGRCYRAQRGWARAERLFHAKRFFSRLYPRETPEPDYLGGERFAAFSGGRGRDADELFHLAVSESVRLSALFDGAMKTGQLPRADFCNGFLTGQPVD